MKFVEEAKKKFQAIQEAYSGNFTHWIFVFYLFIVKYDNYTLIEGKQTTPPLTFW
jgi:hypothetical protein